jgi:hypothetical protein
LEFAYLVTAGALATSDAKRVVLKYHRREKVQSCVSQAGLLATQVARVKDNRVKYTAMDSINDVVCLNAKTKIWSEKWFSCLRVFIF